MKVKKLDVKKNTSGEINVNYTGTSFTRFNIIINRIYNIYLIITYKVCKQKEESQNEKIISNSSNVL